MRVETDGQRMNAEDTKMYSVKNGKIKVNQSEEARMKKTIAGEKIQTMKSQDN